MMKLSALEERLLAKIKEAGYAVWVLKHPLGGSRCYISERGSPLPTEKDECVSISAVRRLLQLEWLVITDSVKVGFTLKSITYIINPKMEQHVMTDKQLAGKAPTRTPVEPRQPRQPKHKFAGDLVIKVESPINPKQPRSDSHRRFALYRSGMSVTEYLTAGGLIRDIACDVERQFIKLMTPDEFEKLREI